MIDYVHYPISQYIKYCDKQFEKPIFCGELPDGQKSYHLNDFNIQTYSITASTVSTSSVVFNGTSTSTTL